MTHMKSVSWLMHSGKLKTRRSNEGAHVRVYSNSSGTWKGSWWAYKWKESGLVHQPSLVLSSNVHPPPVIHDACGIIHSLPKPLVASKFLKCCTWKSGAHMMLWTRMLRSFNDFVSDPLWYHIMRWKIDGFSKHWTVIELMELPSDKVLCPPLT